MGAYVEFIGSPRLAGLGKRILVFMSALGFSPKANGAEAPKKLPLLNILIQLPDRRQHVFPLYYAFVPP